MRGASYAGPIRRASSSIDSTEAVHRTTSVGSVSPTSSSPIFRPNSYISSPPVPAPISTASPSNITRTGSSPSAVGLGFTRQLSTGSSSQPFGQRSPLAPPLSSSPRPIPSPSAPTPRPYPHPGGSYSRSYGRGSSGGSLSGGENSWAGPESLGRRTGRMSFDGRYSPAYAGYGGIRRALDHEVVEEDSKRFLDDAEDDSSDINSFLNMIDSRPQLSAREDMMTSRVQLEEALKGMRASVALQRRTSRLSIREDVRPIIRTAVASPPLSTTSTATDTTAKGSNQPQPQPLTRVDSAPITFPQYRPRTSAVITTTGFDLSHQQSTDTPPNNSSTSSINSQQSRSAYEDEPVGRLELSQDPEAPISDDRGRDAGWISEGNGGGRSRDVTPSAIQFRRGAPTQPGVPRSASDYFSRRQRQERQRESPDSNQGSPDFIAWNG